MSKVIEICRQYGPRVVVFLVIFALVAWVMLTLPKTNLFWEALNLRFAKDERYQLQTLFLPDKRRHIPLLIVGDSLFHRTLAERLGKLPPHEAIVINGYDADDVAAIVRGIRIGMARTKTKICALVLQISPAFAARTMRLDSTPSIRILSRLGKSSVREFFLILREWAASKDDGDLMMLPDRRRAVMIGQARFADPQNENLELALKGLADFNGPVLMLLDDRGTEWGHGSNLVTATREYLSNLSSNSQKFHWNSIHAVQDVNLPPCGR